MALSTSPAATQITFTATVADDCASAQTSTSTIVLSMKYNSTVEYNCTANAAGTCQIQTDSSFPLGYYNVTTYSNLTGYSTGLLVNAPVLPWNGAQARQPAESAVFDERRVGMSPLNFTVNVTDLDLDPNAVKLWMKNSTDDWWVENTTACTNCSGLYFFTSNPSPTSPYPQTTGSSSSRPRTVPAPGTRSASTKHLPRPLR